MPQRHTTRDTDDEERRPVRSRRGRERYRDEEEEEEERAARPDDRETRAEAGERERRPSGGRSSRSAAEAMSVTEAARAAVSSIVDLTGKQPEGITGVQPTEDGWLVGVEVVEDRRVPSSADILALYEAELGPDGTLLSYRRSRRYARGRGDDAEGR